MFGAELYCGSYECGTSWDAWASDEAELYEISCPSCGSELGYAYGAPVSSPTADPEPGKPVLELRYRYSFELD